MATVTSVAPANRWYTVTFDDAWSKVTWTGRPPGIGTTAEFVVTKVLDATRRIMVEPVGDPSMAPERTT